MDEKSAKKVKGRKIFRWCVYAFIAVECITATIKLSEIYHNNPNDIRHGMLMLAAIAIFLWIMLKCVLHDAHSKLTDYEKEKIKKYGLVHFTTLDKAKEIKRLRYIETNRKHFFINLKNDGEWFYMIEGDTEQDIINTANLKRKHCKRFFDKQQTAIVRVKINDKAINQCRLRIGCFNLKDDAICHYGIKLNYIKADIYEFKDGELKEIK